MIDTKFYVYALNVVYGQGKDGQIFEVDFKTPPEMYVDSSSKFICLIGHTFNRLFY